MSGEPETFVKWKMDPHAQRYTSDEGELIWNLAGTAGGWTWRIGTRKLGWYETLADAFPQIDKVVKGRLPANK